MVKKCDICKEKKKIIRKAMIEDDAIIRLYDFCEHCWMVVYQTLVSRLFVSDIKMNVFIKEEVDTLISAVYSSSKIEGMELKGDAEQIIKQLKIDEIGEIKDLTGEDVPINE